MVQETGQQVCVNQDACISFLIMAFVDIVPDTCSVQHLSIRVESWGDPRTMTKEDEALVQMSEVTLLRQFLSEVVDSASNLQTLRKLLPI